MLRTDVQHRDPLRLAGEASSHTDTIYILISESAAAGRVGEKRPSVCRDPL